MAAQKLTKGRLVQIIVMMLLLITAFTYRTITHNEANVMTCSPNDVCEVNIAEKTVTFDYQESSRVLKFTKPEDLTIEIKNIEGVLNKTVNDASISELNLPIELIVSDSKGKSIRVKIEK